MTTILFVAMILFAGWWLYALLFFSKDEPLNKNAAPFEDHECFWHKDWEKTF